MRSIILGAAAITLVATAAPAATPEQVARTASEAALADSAAGWNAGDLARFMAIYADAPTTTYVIGSALAHGPREIATHYADYFGGTKNAERGRLSFETLDFRLIDATHALMIARYTVSPAGRRAEPWTGPTTLLLEHEATGWKIVADHSS